MPCNKRLISIQIIFQIYRKHILIPIAVEGNKMKDMDRPLRVLELFSGIGGMHYALSRANEILTPEVFEFEIVAAIDISDVANQVYRYNFPKTNHSGGNICGLTPEKVNKLEIDAIFMSPPCQPFTRQGNQKDLNDSRTEPLVHIMNLLPHITSLKYILVENVKGFETSSACEKLIHVLHELSFDTKSFLISPTQLGIPNSRLRFYLIAKKVKPTTSRDEKECISSDNIITNLQTINDLPQIIQNTFLSKIMPKKLEEYLRCNNPADNLLLQDDVLSKYGEVLDIVQPTSNTSCCFTKSYGRYAEGTGSVIQQDGDLNSVFERARMFPKKSVEYVSVLRELKLRYLDPYEIADLLGFPAIRDNEKENRRVFKFPPKYLERRLHCYRVLGNSLNVHVVSFLSCILFTW